MKSFESQKNNFFSIYIFAPTLDGGVGRIVTNISKGLLNFNFKVTLLVPNLKGNFRDKVSGEVKIHSFNRTRTSSCIISLAKLLKENKPDVILSLSFHANCVALVARIFVGLPKSVCIISEHINLSCALESLNIVKRFFVEIFIFVLYKKADAWVAVSGGSAEGISKFSGVPRSKIKVIANPVIDENFMDASHENINHTFFVNKKNPVIVTVGRLDYQKDQITLLEAFALVQKERDAKLIICGEGPLRAELEREAQALGIKASVDFLGFVKNPLPYIRASDVFVLSSIYEGLPTVLIEALAIGTPIISTDCPDGPREILDNGKYGTLVRVRDPQALAKALVEVLDGKVILRAEEDYMSQYRVPVAVEKYSSLIKSLLSNE